MQAGRGFVLFLFGKPATGVGLIKMRLFKMNCLVIDLRIITKIRKSSCLDVIQVQKKGSEESEPVLTNP
jgi:hypothetical protein